MSSEQPLVPLSASPGPPEHLRRLFDEASTGEPATPSPAEVAAALRDDPDAWNRLVGAVADDVERRILRDVVRHGRTGIPGMV